LSWIENAEFAGSYVAESRGYYDDAGLEVDLMPGGPDVVTPPVVATEKADVALASTDVAARARANGAPIQIFGAHYQRSPLAITSLADAPIRVPRDLVGRRIGVQASNDSTWKAFLDLNGIAEEDVDSVAVQFDPAPLVNGDVDGFLTFLIDQPLALEQAGTSVENMLLADFGFDLFGQVYIARQADLEARQELFQRFLTAERQGWTTNFQNPALGARLTIERSPKSAGLELESELALNKAQEPLFTPANGGGLLQIDAASVAANQRTLRLLGIEPDASLFELGVSRSLAET
jgi:ABC-type nitrate/sulfonate/bicarbonate transport system substrate-binding protein